MDNVGCEPCKARDRTMSSVHWCVNCEESLCIDCTENHRAMKVSRNHQLVDIAEMPAQVNITSQSCLKHDELPFDYFCIAHDALCCKECLAMTHRTCEKVMSVDMASKGAKQSQSYLDIIELLKQILETTQAFTKDRTDSIQHLDTEIKQIKDTITKAKIRMVNYLDSLEESLHESLNCQKDKIIFDMKESITEAKTIEEHANQQKHTFELVETHGSDKQAFLLVQTSKQQLTDVEERTGILTDKAINPDFSFIESNWQSTELAVGSIKLTEGPCAVKFVPRKKRQSQIPVAGRNQPSFVPEGEINLKLIEGSTFVTSMTVTNNNMLLLCDFSNPRVLVYDVNNTILRYQIDTTYYPWDIAMIPDSTTAVVSSYSDEYIQFIDTNIRSVVRVEKVPLSNLGGIATTKEYIFVGSLGKINILDHNGYSMRTIKAHDERTPWFISVNRSGDIYYSNPLSFVCLKPDGKRVFSYQPLDIKTPRNMATDSNGNILIVGSESCNIHRLRPNGTLIDIILKKEDGLDFPIAFCFGKDHTKLYVSNSDGTVISVFKKT